MVIPLPSALADFSKTALKNIEALSAIQQSVPDVQASVRNNITAAVRGSILSEVGNLFSDIPEFLDQSGLSFVQKMTEPAGLSLGLQHASFEAVFGTGAVSGSGVEQFLEANIRLEGVLPAQRLFSVIQSLGSVLMYADPMQAYAQAATMAADIKNLCEEAESVIATVSARLADLLSAQGSVDYTQISLLTQAHFSTADGKLQSVLTIEAVLEEQLSTRGKYDPTTVGQFCAAVSDLVNFINFADTKILQLDLLRKEVESGIQRLRVIGRELLAIFENTKNYISNYVQTVSSGKLFREVQKRVLKQARSEMDRARRDLRAMVDRVADDRSKLRNIWSVTGLLQAVKAFICRLDPGTDAVDPGGSFAAIKVDYDVFVGDLSSNDPTAEFENIENQTSGLLASMNAAVIRDNSSSLSTTVSDAQATLAALTALLTGVCASSQAFLGAFEAFSGADPGRLVGPANLFSESGLSNATDALRSADPGDAATLSLSEATKPGQLAASIAARVAELPDGHEKEQLTLLYDEVFARHRATILSMDFQQREQAAGAQALTEEEQNRALVNKATQAFSGIDKDEFDEVLLT